MGVHKMVNTVSPEAKGLRDGIKDGLTEVFQVSVQPQPSLLAGSSILTSEQG